jgi:transposase-like protein
MKNGTFLVFCPKGHSFITAQSLSQVFLCPDCNEDFEEHLGYKFSIA